MGKKADDKMVAMPMSDSSAIDVIGLAPPTLSAGYRAFISMGW